jgi:muramoyltetrapeptide carboxypeptidase
MAVSSLWKTCEYSVKGLGKSEGLNVYLPRSVPEVKSRRAGRANRAQTKKSLYGARLFAKMLACTLSRRPALPRPVIVINNRKRGVRGQRSDVLLRNPLSVNKPPALKTGGRIGVVAPAGCVEEASLQRGVEALRDKGFAVELAPHVLQQKGYLAGTVEQRALDLEGFFRRNDIDAIFCARGGFGSIQLLPSLARALPLPPKILAGYSDITILLNWFLQTSGLVTFHAPMVAMDFANGIGPRSSEHLWGTLAGEKTRWSVGFAEAVRPGKARAALVGGCLSLLVTTLGTPYEIDTTGRLLFLEDVGEKPYRVERMLTHLKMAGKLAAVAGVVFGDFTHCDGAGARDIRQIVAELFEDAPYPVVTGVAAGHGRENLLLPFGVDMMLDADAGALSLMEAAVSTVRRTP